MAAPEARDTPLLDRDWLRRFGARLGATDRLLLCLDFDGTLAPIVDDPDDAALTPANARLLRRLADEPSVTVAIVSGRSLDDLRDRVDVDGIHYAGNHGLEWGDATGRTVAVEARESRQALSHVVDRVRSQLSDIPGCRVEDKGLTATVHYRLVPDARVPTAVEVTRDVVASMDKLQCRPGKEIVEIRPDVPAGKDRAVGRLRDRFPDAVALFVGDDVSDEDAFRVAEDNGYGILVGDRSGTAASVRVPDPGGVTMLLAWLVHDHLPSRGTDEPTD